ncbi:MAG: type VI secretion system baseplate subunit TssG [Tunicatimonas sp.]
MRRPTAAESAAVAPSLPNLTLERYVDELLLVMPNRDDTQLGGEAQWPVLICSQGTFRRSYQQDILAVAPSGGQTESVRIDVAREGLYDMLPEGVFHESPPGGAGIDTEAAVGEVEQNRREEQEARRFFLPIEQEFYRQKIALEHQEHAYFQSARPGSRAGAFLRKLWGVPADLLPAQQQGFLLLAPHLHRLAGRLPEVERCFAFLLPVPVQLTQQYHPEAVSMEQAPVLLGDTTLGHDAVLGETLDDPWPYWQLTLGPMKGEQLRSFLEGGSMNRFIRWLSGYLLPAGVDYYIDIEVATEDQAFCLRDDTSFMGRLGHTTYLT